jgi:HEAT repeat protein/cyclophilin family peptidyl-prolyl cis-trans isomerase
VKPSPSFLHILATIAVIAGASPHVAVGQRTVHRALSASDIDDIARLEMMEDRRQVDTLNVTEVARLLAAEHPEVRRRAAITVGRLADVRSIPLLLGHPLDPDTAIAASVVWAIGQIGSPGSVVWLDSILTNSKTMPTVAAEAAIALGKIVAPTARGSLEQFLGDASLNARTRAAIGEALLSIGRFTKRGDIAPIIKWATSSDDEIRWSATWALARLRDPAGVSTLIPRVADKSALIRSWAVRGLGRPQADSAGVAPKAEALLLAATRDADRTVRTEATRTLASYNDSTAVSALVAALKSADSWISVSAAEGLGTIRSAATIPALVAATAASSPCALRMTARLALQTFAQDTSRPALQTAARDPALAALIDISHDTVPYCRTTAIQSLRRATNLPPVGTVARTTIDSILAAAPPATPGQRPAPAALTRTLADYRAIVERWVVPDYSGKAPPTAHWDTPRGPIEIELYAGDAPLAVDDFVYRIESGAIVGTQFTRVVPDFVDQQETIKGGTRIRDEVNRRGLTRANLAWATAGLDTGNPGYTLAHTPQPHNEGKFTSLGRVVRGMDAADQIELGDRVTGARMLTGGTP